MRIESVLIKNFRGFGENSQDSEGFYRFDQLDSNFTLISGNNGYGKTSFFEAIEWALTDGIDRIKNYKNVYHTNTLQSKQNLKFMSPDSDCEKQREVTVVVNFNDGVQIYRRSNNKFVKISEGSNYSSEVIYSKNGETIYKDDLITLGYPDFESNSFLKNHFLMQESVSAFFKTIKPRERQELIMELLNIDELNELHKQTDDLISGEKFESKIKDIKSHITQLDEKKQSLESRLENAGFPSVKIYQTQFNNLVSEFIKIKNIKDEDIKNKINEIENLQKEKRYNLKETYNLMESIKSSANKKNEKLKDNKVRTKTINKILHEYDSLSRLRSLLIKNQQLKNIKNTDIAKDKRQIEIKKHQLKRIEKMEQLFKKRHKENMSKVPTTNFEFLNFIEKLLTINNIKQDLLQLVDHKEINYIFEGFKQEEIEEKHGKISKEIEIIKVKIKELDDKNNEHSKLNEDYGELLDTAMKYIQNYEVDNCPVCLNTDFSDKKYTDIKGINDNNITDSLLSIILKIKSNGNEKVKIIVEEIQKLNKEITDKKKLKKEIEEYIDNIITSINEKIVQLQNNYTALTTDKYERLAKFKHKINLKLMELEGKNKMYNKNKKELQLADDSNIDESILNNDKEIQTILNENEDFKKINLSESDVKSKVQERKITLEDRYKFIIDEKNIKESIKNLDKELKNIDESINYNQIVLSKLDQLEIFLLNDTQFDDIEIYFTVEDKKKILNGKISEVETLKDKVKEYRGNIKDARNEYMSKMVIKQPIIKWIYSMLNPHKFYRDIDIVSTDTSFNVTDDNKRIFLDHIFSSAQTNILSLSIFLGMGLSFRKNKLENLLIDDPIQSLDDVNILTLIDIFRALPRSNYNNIKLIISSHDEKFSQLLSIKMRNHNFTHYSFEDYTNEGPIIKKLA